MKTAFAAGAAIAMLCFGFASAQANDKLIEMAKNPKDWVIPLGNYAGHRYSALDQINESNVSKLQVAWMFSTGVLRGHEGAPLKIGNMLYLVTPFPNNVMAWNLDEQRFWWWYEPKQITSEIVPRMCCDTVNRGLAYSNGTLFMQQADTTLVALDARTSKERWKIANGNPKLGETATAAPLVVKNKVIAGISGGEFGARCHLTAYEFTPDTWNPEIQAITSDVSRSWRAYTTGPDKEILFDPEKTTSLGKPVGKDSSLATWTGEDWKIGGGCAHGWITYDPELNLIYYGTGNPAPWNPVQRPGDNRWTSSIIARDVDTGIARWVYQTTPHDEWDYDATAEGILIDLPGKDGTQRKALVQFNKNGLVYALDRATGELISADKFEPSTNWTSGVDMDPASAAYGKPKREAKYSPFSNGQDVNTKGICPHMTGAKGPAPAAWNSSKRIFLVPMNSACMDLEPFKVSHTPGEPYVGATIGTFPRPESHGGEGELMAWDADKHKRLWTIPYNFGVNSGPLTTAGGLVFFGTIDGDFKVLQLADGKQVYAFKVGSGIIGNPFAFEHKGKQYVGVYSGVGGYSGGAFNIAGDFDAKYCLYCSPSLRQYTNLGGTLVVFALPDSEIAPQKAIPAAAPTPARP